MSTYNLLLFAHVAFVVIWLGSNTALQVLAVRAQSAGPTRSIEFLSDVEWLGRRLQSPASLLVLVFGVWLALYGGFDFTDTWILIGLAAFALAFLVAIAYLQPQSGRIAQLVNEHGPDHPEVRARTRRVLLVSRIELLILFAVILNMVVKPGT
jgi:uncharacterized membrane protein